MSATTYRLPVTGPIFTDDTLMKDLVLHWAGDYDEPAADSSQSRTFTYTDALAASGDYFVTLATRLDKLAQGLPQDSAEQIELEHIVEQLLHLQDHWALRRRPEA